MTTTATLELSVAGACAVYAQGTITSSGASVIAAGDVCGNAIVGFPPAVISDGAILSDAVGAIRGCVIAAYDAARARTGASPLAAELSNLSYTPGLYACPTAAAFASGTLTLDGAGVYVFQIEGALAVAAGVSVVLTNGAAAKDVFWQVTGAVTVGAGSHIVGTLLSGGAITLGAGVVVDGRLMAPYAAITVDACTITRPPVVDPAVLAAELTVVERANLVAFTTGEFPFGVEYPDGAVIDFTHRFGDDIRHVIRQSTNASDCCAAGVRWRLVTDTGAPVADARALCAVTAEDQPLHVVPKADELLQLSVKPANAVQLVVKAKDRTTRLEVDGGFTVRYYQRRIRSLDPHTPTDRHVWIDGNGDFINPSTLVRDVVNPVSIATCDDAAFARAQLPA
jgi:hypothetical protein